MSDDFPEEKERKNWLERNQLLVCFLMIASHACYYYGFFSKIWLQRFHVTAPVIFALYVICAYKDVEFGIISTYVAMRILMSILLALAVAKPVSPSAQKS